MILKTETLPNKKNILVWYPDAPGKYPAILFTHGLGECGNGTTDLNRVMNAGLPKALRNGLQIPFVVFASQDSNGWWVVETELNVIIDYMLTNKSVDTNKMGHTGLSSGGDAVYRNMKDGRDLFAWFAPISINSNQYTTSIPKMHGRPVYHFHGERDSPNNLIGSSEAFIDEYVKKFGNAKRTVFTNLGHNSWDTVYTSKLSEPQTIIKGNPAFSPFDQTLYDWALQFSLNAEPPKEELIELKVFWDPNINEKVFVDSDGKRY